MNTNFYIREITPKAAHSVIEGIGFDKSYINVAEKKYNFKLLKVCGLTCQQAAIVKQTALSIGTDAAVHREVITCKIEKSDLLLCGTVAQLENICQKLKKQPFKLSELSEQLLQKIKPQKHKWSNKTHIMGILNITPDSFSDGGKYFNPDIAVQHAVKMIENGADIIDIGGESTRPYSQEVSPDEELDRVLPVIEKIRNLNDKILLSIDTRHAKVAQKAINAGVNIINDVSGLEWEEEMASVAAQAGVPVVIMHSLASPETMQVSPTYKENIVDAVYKSLFYKTQKAINAGIQPENIIIDPGIGFGKTIEHNFELIKRISEFKSLGYAVLIGLSRKSFIYKTLDSLPEDIEAANVALNSYAAISGADIIRVHDVAAHFKAIQILRKLY